MSASRVEERGGALPAQQFTRLFPAPAARFHGSRSARPGPIPVPHGRDRLARRLQDTDEAQRQFGTGRVGVMASIQRNARKQVALGDLDALETCAGGGLRQRELRTPEVSDLELTPSHRLQPRSRDLGRRKVKNRASSIFGPLNGVQQATVIQHVLYMREDVRAHFQSFGWFADVFHPVV